MIVEIKKTHFTYMIHYSPSYSVMMRGAMFMVCSS